MACRPTKSCGSSSRSPMPSTTPINANCCTVTSPANILLAELDSGGWRRCSPISASARRVDDSSGLTQTGMAVGTVAYAAPEQLMGLTLDGRTDQYSLAATAFELLTEAHLYPRPQSRRRDQSACFCAAACDRGTANPNSPAWAPCCPRRSQSHPATATTRAWTSPKLLPGILTSQLGGLGANYDDDGRCGAARVVADERNRKSRKRPRWRSLPRFWPCC